METKTNFPLGCWIDHAPRNAQEVDIAIISIAESYGYSCDWCGIVVEAVDNPESLYEILQEEAEEATMYLSDMETRPYVWIGDNGETGAFGAWVDWESVEEDIRDEEISSSEEIPEDSPKKTVWIHTNDHGNTTLYTWTGTKWKEQWSVV